MTIGPYPKMNARIVNILRINSDNPVPLYAAQRIEELEAEVERLRAEVEHLRVLMPSVDLLRCLADYTDSATDSQHHYQPDLAASGIVAAREARALAHHIEEIQAND